MEKDLEQQIKDTKNYLENMTNDETEALATWLVNNGYGLE